MRGLNLALRFVIEIACLAALAYWGAGATASTPANIALAVLSPLAAATVWGIWSAPRASRRLTGHRLAALELALLICCCGLLALAWSPWPAGLLALVALINAALLRQQGPDAPAAGGTMSD